MCIRCLKEGDDPVIPSLFDPNKLRKTKRKKQIEQIISQSSAEGNTTDADIHTARSGKFSDSAVTTEHLPELNSSLSRLRLKATLQLIQESRMLAFDARGSLPARQTSRTPKPPLPSGPSAAAAGWESRIGM